MHSLLRRLPTLVVTLTLIACSGCSDSTREEATGKSTIRGVNSIATSPELAFLIEERVLANVGYKGSSGSDSFDDLSYNFNFDVLLPGETEPDRVATQFLDVVANNEYTILLTGTFDNPSTTVWEDPEREFQTTDTIFELFFAHLSPALSTVDVYFAALGTAPVLGQAIGSIANGDRTAGMDFEAGIYELIITANNDPTTVLYQSPPIATTAQTRSVLAIFDADPSITGNVAVNLIGTGGSVPLADVNSPAQLRVLHAASGTNNVDGYLAEDFSTIVYPDVGFGTLSANADFPDAATTLTLTAVGNTGAIIHEEDISAIPGSKRTAVLNGAPGELFLNVLANDARPLSTFPVLRFANFSVNAEFVDIYALEPGTVITEEIAPTFGRIPTRIDTGFFGPPAGAGMLEVTVTVAGEVDPFTTPVTLDLSNGDIVDLFILDTADPTIAELLVIDDAAAP